MYVYDLVLGMHKSEMFNSIFIPSLGISQVDEESHEILSPSPTETSGRVLRSEYQPSNSKFSE